LRGARRRMNGFKLPSSSCSVETWSSEQPGEGRSGAGPGEFSQGGTKFKPEQRLFHPPSKLKRRKGAHITEKKIAVAGGELKDPRRGQPILGGCNFS